MNEGINTFSKKVAHKWMHELINECIPPMNNNKTSRHLKLTSEWMYEWLLFPKVRPINE